MAPEQLIAYRAETCALNFSSDLYSLGVILYELLTGHHPFSVHCGQVKYVLDRMISDRSEEPAGVRKWNSGIPPAVESIVRHCLEPNPSKRYQGARELQEDLQRQLDHLPLKYAPEPSWRERFGKWVYRHPGLTSSTSVALVAALVLLGVVCWLGLRMGRLAHLEAVAIFAQFEDQM